MPDAYVLSENDVKALKGILSREKARVVNPRNRGKYANIEDEEMPTPDVYIARVPTGGIPALSEGPGTGSGSGTGPLEIADDIPGAADCDIYRVIIQSNGDPYLEPIDGLTKTVYNLSIRPVPEYKWTQVIKDKFGTWQVPSIAGVEVNMVTEICQTNQDVTFSFDIDAIDGGTW